MKAAITAIEYHLPIKTVSNHDLSAEFPEWPMAKIGAKTGIETRHIAALDETAGDLGVAAARKLFASGVAVPAEIDFLILCTQAPDYVLPTTACILQNTLGIPVTAGALDINLGCSGFVYGLGLAKALIENGQARNILFITADTYSRFIHPGDKSVRSLFGDGAAATLIRAVIADGAPIDALVYGTDGSGAKNLIVPTGGARRAHDALSAEVSHDKNGNLRSPNNLYMNGQEVFTFTLKAVPALVKQVLAKAGAELGDIDQYVFHQANAYMMEGLRKKIGIPAERFVVHLADCGNTVSSTIPIALKHAVLEGKLKPGHTALIAGFGVGYSWAGAVLRWNRVFA